MAEGRECEVPAVGVAVDAVADGVVGGTGAVDVTGVAGVGVAMAPPLSLVPASPAEESLALRNNFFVSSETLVKTGSYLHLSVHKNRGTHAMQLMNSCRQIHVKQTPVFRC